MSSFFIFFILTAHAFSDSINVRVISSDYWFSVTSTELLRTAFSKLILPDTFRESIAQLHFSAKISLFFIALFLWDRFN
jgi:hypothetical protein